MGKDEKEYTWNLLAKKLTGEASPEELQELEMLLRRNPELHYPMQTLIDLWHSGEPSRQAAAESAFNRLLDRLERLNTGFTTSDPSSIGDYPSTPEYTPVRKSRSFRTLLIASLIAVTLASTWLILYPGHNRQPLSPNPPQASAAPVLNEVVTANGSRTHLTLPDGTRVWLNAGSRLTYDKNYGSARREINLTGEAFFDVANNPHQPFIIHTPRMDVRVLGTSFNVKSYAADKTTEATLVRGSIAISIKNRLDETILLKPNQKLIVTSDLTTLLRHEPGGSRTMSDSTAQVSIRPPSYEQNTGAMIETSWVNNKFIFKDEDFGTLSKDLERWYGVSISLTDPAQADWRFTGNFEKETIRQALDALKLTAKFNYVIQGNQIQIITNK
jgi:ferric-dicitrate binding protein FerR (iron transport regulator)